MSKKWTALFVGVVAPLAFAAGTMQGCGSSSSGDYAALCKQGCDRVISCTPDADAATVSQIRTACESACGSNCSNNSARISAGKACLAMSDCTAFESCGATIPACQTTTGTGGNMGTGGSGTGGSGTGGTSGGGWTCQDQPAQGGNPAICVCIQSPGGTLTSCPSSETCCFTSNLGGVTECSCTTPPTGTTCAQLVQAIGGTQASKCP